MGFRNLGLGKIADYLCDKAARVDTIFVYVLTRPLRLVTE